MSDDGTMKKALDRNFKWYQGEKESTKKMARW